MNKTTIFLVIFLIVIGGCTSPVVKNQISEAETQIEPPATNTPEITATFTTTLEPTATETLTPTSTITITPTHIKLYDKKIGPAIVAVDKDEDPAEFENFLNEAKERDYEFATFRDFDDLDKPMIILFDEVRTSNIPNNQMTLLEIMKDYGNAALAVYTDTYGGPGAEYIYDLINYDNWQHCIQAAKNSTDMTLNDYTYVYEMFGDFQFRAEDYIYDFGLGMYPTCATPKLGLYSEAYIDQINSLNAWGKDYPQVLEKPITIIVSDKIRDTIDGYIEVYPAIWSLDFSQLPY